ncbi:hypothetical protein AGRO_4902 [Agrobacterium sp. ATCC 31749]|nr:hypothetical protein AGRO_4902 [Agrobacterium sp. ATCC 31749]
MVYALVIFALAVAISLYF